MESYAEAKARNQSGAFVCGLSSMVGADFVLLEMKFPVVENVSGSQNEKGAVTMPESKSMYDMAQEGGRITAIGGIGILVVALVVWKQDLLFTALFLMILGASVYVGARLLKKCSSNCTATWKIFFFTARDFPTFTQQYLNRIARLTRRSLFPKSSIDTSAISLRWDARNLEMPWQ